MGNFSRRALLGNSLWGASAALTPLPAFHADAAEIPAPGNAEHWIIDDTSAIADTDSGKVMGYIRDGVRVFKGIPYAEVLTPEGRWRRGAKVRPWAGKRSSRAAGPVCPTRDHEPGPGPDEAAMRDSDVEATRASEDCLRVNVWTPGIDNKKRQVLFYCHVGGYAGGSSLMSARYEAHNLSKYGDVVVVSVNHRLHALGFLDLSAYGPDYADSANVGMLDIIDALKWVKTNIANFGGDPSRVMIFGYSGGGSKVLSLLAMPEARGLFNRVVAMSGAPIMLASKEQSLARTAAFLKLLGIAPGDIGALIKLPLGALLREAGGINSAFSAARDRFDGWGTAAAEVGWRPVVDGVNVSYDPTLPNTTSDIPLLIGNTLHETFDALDHPEYVKMPEPQARAIVRTAYGPGGDDIYDVYKNAFPRAIPYEISAMARAMGHFRAYSIKVAQRRAALSSAPTYNYWVHWRAGTFEGRAMSHHEIETPLVFLNSDAIPTVTGASARARKLSLRIADTWLAFAHAGNPNTKALPDWKPVTSGAMTTMILDDTCHIDHGADLAAIELYWKSRYPNV